MRHLHKNVANRNGHAGSKDRSTGFDFNNSLMEQSQQQQCSIMMETKDQRSKQYV